MNISTRVWALTAALAMMVVPAAADQPPIFSDKTLEEANQTARAEQIVLVYATADWCPPCRRMKETTWVDDRVTEWLERNAIVVVVDVDEQPDLASELRVRGIPAMIAFRDGEEFDRVSGYHDPDRLIGWLEGVQAGERERDRRLADPEALDMRERIALARELLDAGEHEQATEQYVYIWERMHDEAPRLAGLRPTIAMQIGELIEAHEPAREPFARLRDEAKARIEEQPTRADVGDWIFLNAHALDDEERIIEWASGIRDDEDGLEMLRRFGWQLRPVFEEHNRLDLVGALETNPELQVQTLWRQVEMVESPEGVGVWAMMDERYDIEGMEPEDFEDPGFQAEVRAVVVDHFITEVATLYTSLLAAQRQDDAEAVADMALERLDTAGMRLAMVRTAAEHDQTHPRHQEWLEQASELDPEVIEEVEELRQRLHGQPLDDPPEAPGRWH